MVDFSVQSSSTEAIRRLAVRTRNNFDEHLVLCCCFFFLLRFHVQCSRLIRFSTVTGDITYFGTCMERWLQVGSLECSRQAAFQGPNLGATHIILCTVVMIRTP